MYVVGILALHPLLVCLHVVIASHSLHDTYIEECTAHRITVVVEGIVFKPPHSLAEIHLRLLAA